MNKAITFCFVLLFCNADAGTIRTDAEKVDFVKGRLAWYYQASASLDHADPNDADAAAELAAYDRWNAQAKTLHTVFDDTGASSNVYTFAENCEAFTCFLNTLGTNNWQLAMARESTSSSNAVSDRDALQGLFFFVRDASYTNAYPQLKALALNPHGVMRSKALELAIQLGPVDDAMTDFVETVMTNKTDWTLEDRGAWACGGYASRLLALSPTGNEQRAVKSRAVNMFYRHRKVDVAGAEVLDDLFVDCLTGYSTSSNRLDEALFILGHPDCDKYDRRTFSNVTNQLLSSGQPLHQLNIGEAGE